MKQIAIYCVNYHSNESLGNYLLSIDAAMEEAIDAVQLSVWVADNTVPATTISYQPRHFSLKILTTGENKGYFGAIRFLMKRISPMDFDFVIISNVDVLMDKSFFTQLNNLGIDTQVGWIAPEIFSRVEQRDRNPKIMQRYPKRKLQILKLFFRIPPLYTLYTHTAYKSKKLIRHQPCKIYAGHGSFIILTHNYFQQCGIICYPVFLFCEEIYLGEQCQQHQLKVVYNPTIKVTDAEHASTGTFRHSSYCRYNYQAISYILKTYY